MTAAPKFIVTSVPVDEIFVAADRRPVDEGAVTSLMESIRQIGLQTPITIRYDADVTDPETGEIEGGYALVVGAHRLEAARRLGMDRIPAVVREWDDIDAELWEITENLHRSNLTTEQKYIQLRRYAEVILKREAREAGKAAEIRVGQTVQPEYGYKKPPPAKKEIAQKVADETGVSAKTVHRALYQPDPAKLEADNAKKAHDKVIKADLSADTVELLEEKFVLHERPHLISLLEGASLKEIIGGLRRGLHDTPVMDRSAA